MTRRPHPIRAVRLPHRIGALALWIMLGGPAQAQDATYRLAPGDRLGLSVYGQSELSGEFVVNGSGALFLPLVGEVSVSAMTLPEAQKQIVSRLADGYLQQPVVSLRITEMRPIYLLGDVRVAGSYPFRYGASVLSGIALAGGFALPEQAQIAQRTDFLASDERVRVLEATLRLLTVRRERLEAQRRDRDDFTPPPGSDRDEGFARLLAEERGILKTQRGAFAQSAEMLRAQKPRIEAEIAGVEAQRKAEETQLRLIQSHLEDYEKLISNGLARRYQGIELQREEARNKGTIARLNSELARLDLAIGDLALRGQELADTYHRRILTELQDVTTRLTEIEMQLPSAREIREARLQSGGMLGAAPSGPPARKVFITRTMGERTDTFEADERALLQPGDIVDVRREPPTAAVRTSLALPEPGGTRSR